MVPTLAQNRRPIVENFYQNSFKQLSDVQQKQVGLLVGAYVADAAARALDGYSATEIAEMEQKWSSGSSSITERGGEEEGFVNSSSGSNNAVISSSSSTSSSSTPKKGSVKDAVAFVPLPRAQLRGYTALQQLDTATQGHSVRRPSDRNPLLFHSFTALFYEELVRTMSDAKGDFPVSEVQDKWIDVSLRVDGGVFAAEHASLLHTLCTLLPLPATYPYASDDSLRDWAQTFTHSLTELPSEVLAQGDVAVAAAPGSDLGTYTIAEAAAAERQVVSDLTLSALGVLLRYLQSNPDPVRNGAFMALPGAQPIFPSDVAAFCPAVKEGSSSSRARCIAADLLLKHQQQQPLPAVLLPRRPALADAAVVQESFHIARAARSFTAGVCQAIRGGGPTCQRAMLVGALLGARYGARHIPPAWLSATEKHKVVSTLSIDVAQWAWNPPHH